MGKPEELRSTTKTSVICRVVSSTAFCADTHDDGREGRWEGRLRSSRWDKRA